MTAHTETATLAGPIPVSEVSFDTDSPRDPDGRVFSWRGETLRGISADRAPFFHRLIAEGTLEDIGARGLLVHSSLTDLSLDGYGLVVRHPTIPFVSYPTEWLPTMLRDAALVTLDLVEALAEHDLTLKDAHPWNVLFDGSAPVHVDLTSIVPARAGEAWPAQNEFVRCFLRPLVLMAHGEDETARKIFDDESVAQLRRLVAIHPTAVFAAVGGVTARWSRALGQVRALRKAVRRIRLPEPPAASAPRTAHSGWRNALARLQPSSVCVLDGAASGVPKLAAATGAAVAALDGEAASSGRLYEAARSSRSRILALPIAAVLDPGPGAIDVRAVFQPERLHADLVLARNVPAAIDRDADSRRRTADRLDLVSGKRLLVEAPPAPGAAAVDAIRELLEDRFRTFRLLESGYGHRSMVLCER
jgi:hypothetical protein